jgi:hypothetical protein
LTFRHCLDGYFFDGPGDGNNIACAHRNDGPDNQANATIIGFAISLNRAALFLEVFERSNRAHFVTEMSHNVSHFCATNPVIDAADKPASVKVSWNDTGAASYDLY